MSKKIIQITKSKYTAPLLLALIIVLQLIHIICVYQSGNNYHGDEVYTYGLSNSFYMPAVEVDGFNNDPKYTNINEWKNSDILREYITVQKGEQFRYDSVWYNQSMDRHPPLYYAALHTIYSFIPDTFSYWPAFALNAVCFIVTQIFIYLLVKSLIRSRYLALLVCVFWGVTPAAITMVLFIRMYCMLTMWTVMFIWFNEKLCQSEKPKPIKLLAACSITLVCGILTQHLFLFVAFITVVGYGIRYLINKKFQLFFIYGFTMLGSVVLAYSIFPPGISQLLGESSSDTMPPFLIQLPIAFRHVFKEITGFLISLYTSYLYAFLMIFLIMFLLSLPIQYLFRDKPAIRNFYGGIIRFFARIKNIRSFRLKKCVSGFFLFCKKSSPTIAVMGISSLAIIMLTAYKINFSVNKYVVRYMFIICPLLIIFVVCIIYLIISKLKHKKIILAVFLICFSVVTSLKGESLYAQTLKSDIEEPYTQFADAQCLVILPSSKSTSIFCIMPKELRSSYSFFITNYDDIKDYTDALKKADTNKPLYTIMYITDRLKDEDYQKYINDIDLALNCTSESIGKWTLPGGTYAVYQAHFNNIIYQME